MKVLLIGTALLALSSVTYGQEDNATPAEGESNSQGGNRRQGPNRGGMRGRRVIRMTKEQFEEWKKKNPNFGRGGPGRFGGRQGGQPKQGGGNDANDCPLDQANNNQGNDAPAGKTGQKNQGSKMGGKRPQGGNGPQGGQGGQRKQQRPQGGNGGNGGAKNDSPSAGGAGSTAEGSAMAAEVIAAHQVYRKEFNCPELKWSAKIAASAQKWANHLASTGTFQHSKGSGYGENLAMGGGTTFTNKRFVDMWGGEKKDYKDGTFPNVAKTGNWADVGHYTQVIWKKTTEVGCGRAKGSKGTYFVCQYNPPGNFQGQRPY